MKMQIWIILACLAACTIGYRLRERSPDQVKAADQEKPTAPEPPAVLNYEQSNGKKLFQHYCAVCHGLSGEGDGFNAFNLNPKPRDLADREAMKSLSDEQLFNVISQGGAERGKSNLMPPWGHALNERQIRYLIAYVRTLRAAQ
jgi:mono/diheme cytochrome c family protein